MDGPSTGSAGSDGRADGGLALYVERFRRCHPAVGWPTTQLRRPLLLAEAGDVEAKVPPKSWLGTPRREGDIDRLSAWLDDAAPQVDALIVALDTLGYGGLINSRRTTESVEDILTQILITLPYPGTSSSR